ncbi:unnamed protein product [Lampetra planeri]
MARVVKVFRTLRNHWKKSTFAVCVLSYGGHWLYGKHCDSVLRTEACQEAREFGRQLIAPQDRLRKATVILNPAACNGKANSLFEKNAAPILHLAGVDITIVKTDYEGQAKKLLELMEETDMLIVAGGGRHPAGSHHRFTEKAGSKDITSATLSILKGETVPLDVLQIKEWPLVRHASVAYLPPTLRPPDPPDHKPPRPNLLYHIYRALKNYWVPPAEEPDNFTVGEFIAVGVRVASYSIDNEAYEAMPVEVRLLPRKLRFFISDRATTAAPFADAVNEKANTGN